VWARQFSTAQGSGGKAVAIDGSANTYVGGYTSGAFPSQSSSGGGDAFLSKTSATGAEVWTRQFGSGGWDTAWGVAVDTSTNIYVVGETSSSTTVGFSDVFIRKYDASGNELWARQFGGSGADVAYGVAVDTVGGVYIAGTTAFLPGQVGLGGDDAFLRKYDASGNVVWTTEFGTSSEDFGYAVALDASGNIYVGGATHGSLPGQTASGCGINAFLRKYDPSANQLWTHEFGTCNSVIGQGTELRSVSVDPAGFVYVAGRTDEALPGQTYLGRLDAFLRKYDASGTVVWTRQFGSDQNDQAYAVASAPGGGVYVGGSTSGALPGQTLTNQAYLVKYDANGVLQWTQQFQGAGFTKGIAVDASDNPYPAGESTTLAFVRKYTSSGS